MRLHEKVKVQQEIIETYEESINELRRYLNSSKFSVDTTVQTSDVIMRLDELKHDLFKINEV